MGNNVIKTKSGTAMVTVEKITLDFYDLKKTIWHLL